MATAAQEENVLLTMRMTGETKEDIQTHMETVEAHQESGEESLALKGGVGETIAQEKGIGGGVILVRGERDEEAIPGRVDKEAGLGREGGEADHKAGLERGGGRADHEASLERGGGGGGAGAGQGEGGTVSMRADNMRGIITQGRGGVGVLVQRGRYRVPPSLAM